LSAQLKEEVRAFNRADVVGISAAGRLAIASPPAPPPRSSLIVAHSTLQPLQRKCRASGNAKLLHTELQGRPLQS